MLRSDPNQVESSDFLLPFGGKLSSTNRWVKLAEIIPWKLIETCYSQSLAGTGMGAPAKQARNQHLTVAKQKKPGKKKINRAIGQQLRHLKRNLGHIDYLLVYGASLTQLSHYQLKCLQVIHTLYQQQLKKHRIVSISQSHIRPIVRGKTGTPTEFGAKISISHLASGYVSLDRLSWDAYNEQANLTEQAELYKERYGHYPESIHADQIYRSKANRNYCQQRGIRLSAKPLGRPKKLQRTKNSPAPRRARAHTRRREIP